MPLFLLGKYLGVKLLSYMVSVCLTLYKNVKTFFTCACTLLPMDQRCTRVQGASQP